MQFEASSKTTLFVYTILSNNSVMLDVNNWII